MKQFLLLACVLFFVSCNQTEKSTVGESDKSETVTDGAEELASELQPGENATEESATNNAKVASALPEGFPFGLSMSDFKQDKVKEYGAGDCYGTLRTYSKENIRLVTDSSSCGDYGGTNSYYLFKDDQLAKVHVKQTSVDFEAAEGQGNYLASEKIFSLQAVPPVKYSRSDRLGQPDYTSLSTDFKVEEIEDAKALAAQFDKDLRATENIGLEE